MSAPAVSQNRTPSQNSWILTSRGKQILRLILDNGIFLALLAEIAIFAFLIPPEIFFSSRNVINIMRSVSGVGILAIFYGIALTAGVIDFSYMGLMTLSAMVFALTYQIWQLPFVAACLLSLAVAVAGAIVNALLVTKARVASIIATIAVSLLALGLSYFLLFAMTNEAYVRFKRQELRELIATRWFDIPAIIFVFLAVLILAWVVMNHTKLGAHLYAVGGNRRAAILNGVNPNRLTYLVFIGLAVGGWVAVLYLMGRALYASLIPGAIGLTAGGGAQGTLIVRPDPLVACLLAGIALFGGSGKIQRILFGLLFLAVLSSGMGLLNAPGAVRVTVDGLAIILALLLDSARRAAEKW
ncbi:MAG: ABC transporter permease [Chloroflexi bacterium]|nr:ABC transporter permease [Chloroflexota bacterium]